MYVMYVRIGTYIHIVYAIFNNNLESINKERQCTCEWIVQTSGSICKIWLEVLVSVANETWYKDTQQ